MHWLFFCFISLIFLTVQAEQPRLQVTGDWSIAVDNFRGSSDGSWEGNMGAFTSLNLYGNLSKEYSIQVGGSYGLYDWAGQLSTSSKNSKTLQQQGFLTGAISKAGTDPSNLHAGLVYDWMFNRHFGEFSVDPTLSQVRGQLGYLFRGGNEFGSWATINAHTAHAEYKEIALIFKAINQVNLFWCHYFKTQAYTMLWVGTSYKTGLMYRSKKPGRYIVGARFNAGVNKNVED